MRRLSILALLVAAPSWSAHGPGGAEAEALCAEHAFRDERVRCLGRIKDDYISERVAALCGEHTTAGAAERCLIALRNLEISESHEAVCRDDAFIDRIQSCFRRLGEKVRPPFLPYAEIRRRLDRALVHIEADENAKAQRVIEGLREDLEWRP